MCDATRIHTVDDMTKNLVVCCDGTWKNADDKYVSNVEKLARSVAPVGFDGETQIVHYTRGVGSTGSRIERILAGAFGFGLDDAIIDCYRFLALNYEPGDHVFVFGFSRGAYTARSLCGMIAHVGLLTPMGVAMGQLPAAMDLYRNRPQAKNPTQLPPEDPAHEEALRRLDEHSHGRSEVAVEFLGVFDTVGALGIPGIARSKYKFHDVTLSSMVRCARQALAISERRRVFAPCLWGGTHDDIRQVWFDGVHSDVGGGYENCYYSDKSLLWMAAEATSRADGGRIGMAIDWQRLAATLCRDDESVAEHNSLTPLYRITNVFSALRDSVRRTVKPYVPLFADGWRNFAPTVAVPGVGYAPACDVRLERSALKRAENPNMEPWFSGLGGSKAERERFVVAIPGLPSAQWAPPKPTGSLTTCSSGVGPRRRRTAPM